jgi:hypothetical protein
VIPTNSVISEFLCVWCLVPTTVIALWAAAVGVAVIIPAALRGEEDRSRGWKTAVTATEGADCHRSQTRSATTTMLRAVVYSLAANTSRRY